MWEVLTDYERLPEVVPNLAVCERVQTPSGMSSRVTRLRQVPMLILASASTFVPSPKLALGSTPASMLEQPFVFCQDGFLFSLAYVKATPDTVTYVCDWVLHVTMVLNKHRARHVRDALLTSD